MPAAPAPDLFAFARISPYNKDHGSSLCHRRIDRDDHTRRLDIGVRQHDLVDLYAAWSRGRPRPIAF